MTELARAKAIAMNIERIDERLRNVPELITTDGVGPHSVLADDLELNIRDKGATDEYVLEHPFPSDEPIDCEAHPTRTPAQAVFPVSLPLHVPAGAYMPVTVDGRTEYFSGGTILFERVLLLCLDCALWRMSIAKQRQFTALEKALLTERNLTICDHVAAETARAVWVCGATGCPTDALFCEECAVQHSHTHSHSDPGGCAIPGCEEPVYVPKFMPVTRLWVREATIAGTDRRAWLNGYVFALNVGSNLCQLHLAPSA